MELFTTNAAADVNAMDQFTSTLDLQSDESSGLGASNDTSTLSATTTTEFVPLFVSDITIDIKFYSLPVIIAVGCIFNAISFIVFAASPMRKSSSAVYFAMLAVTDTLCLLMEFIRWISDPRIGVAVTQVSQPACKANYHLRYFSQLLSAVLVVTVTVERYVAVVHPLKVAGFARLKTARWTVFVEVLVCLALASYGSILFEIINMPYGKLCLLNFSNFSAYRYSNLVISKIFGEIVTSLVVTICTGVIIFTLVRSRKQRSRMGAAGGGGGSGSSSSSKAGSTDFQLTLMLVVIAVAFVLLRVPYTVCWYVSHYLGTTFSSRQQYALAQALNIAYVVMTLSYSINFFLYSLWGSKFRRHLSALCCRRRHERGLSSSKYSPNTALSTISISVHGSAASNLNDKQTGRGFDSTEAA